MQIRQYFLQQNSSDETKAILYNKIGSALRYSGRYDEAKQFLERGVQLAIKNELLKEQADALYQFGDLANLNRAYFKTDSLDSAQALVSQSVAIYEGVKDFAGISQCLYRRGTILQIHGDSKKSVPAFNDRSAYRGKQKTPWV